MSTDPSSPAPAPVPGADKKLVAGLLAILLGWTGAHKFYLGYQKEACIHLAIGICTCFLPMTIVGIIEGITYLTKSDQEFVDTYVKGRKPWF